MAIRPNASWPDRTLRLALFVLAVAVVFILSVVFCLLLLPAALIGILASAIGEAMGQLRRYTTLEVISWTWLILIVPTFGIMPLLIAPRLHWQLPMGNTLGIFTGITLSEVYNWFVPSSSFVEVDHPFPPVTNVQLFGFGLSVLLVSVLPVAGLLALSRYHRRQ